MRPIFTCGITVAPKDLHHEIVHAINDSGYGIFITSLDTDDDRGRATGCGRRKRTLTSRAQSSAPAVRNGHLAGRGVFKTCPASLVLIFTLDNTKAPGDTLCHATLTEFPSIRSTAVPSQ